MLRSFRLYFSLRVGRRPVLFLSKILRRSLRLSPGCLPGIWSFRISVPFKHIGPIPFNCFLLLHLRVIRFPVLLLFLLRSKISLRRLMISLLLFPCCTLSFRLLPKPPSLFLTVRSGKLLPFLSYTISTVCIPVFKPIKFAGRYSSGYYPGVSADDRALPGYCEIPCPPGLLVSLKFTDLIRPVYLSASYRRGPPLTNTLFRLP